MDKQVQLPIRYKEDQEYKDLFNFDHDLSMSLLRLVTYSSFETFLVSLQTPFNRIVRELLSNAGCCLF